jgi:hypothetical protein
MSAKTTDHASNAPSRPDDFLRSNSASGIWLNRCGPVRRAPAGDADAAAAGGGGVDPALLTDHHVHLFRQLT